jgi:hypothetical protein
MPASAGGGRGGSGLLQPASATSPCRSSTREHGPTSASRLRTDPVNHIASPRAGTHRQQCPRRPTASAGRRLHPGYHLSASSSPAFAPTHTAGGESPAGRDFVSRFTNSCARDPGGVARGDRPGRQQGALESHDVG